MIFLALNNLFFLVILIKGILNKLNYHVVGYAEELITWCPYVIINFLFQYPLFLFQLMPSISPNIPSFFRFPLILINIAVTFDR